MIQRWYRTNRVFLVGLIAVGFAVAISSFGVVRAEHAKPNSSVSYSCNTGSACVEGSSTGTGTWGVYGVGSKDDGVRGVTTTSSGGNGVTGMATGSSTSGSGVYGKALHGDGVYGSSSGQNQSGVYGQNTSTYGFGIYGSSPNAYGVYGTGYWGVYGKGLYGVYGASSSSYGVFGEGPGDVGVYGTGLYGVSAESRAAGYDALLATADYTSTAIFYGHNTANSSFCNIDQDANLTCTGKISGSSRVEVQHTTSENRHVLAYASESATPTIEDLGAARMRDGVANVEIPSDFASVIDRSNAYYVFLTPMGDTRGLYVSTQNAGGFQVRENMRGRSNVEFQYRVIAVPRDAKNVRLPSAPAIKPPQLPRR